VGALGEEAPPKPDPLVERLQELALKPPFVTVVVTVYNYQRYLRPCLESIATQTYPAFKCVVIDDCSSDGSAALVEQFIAERPDDHRFTLIKHAQNLGQMAGFKTGLAHADGEFLAYVDADDVLLPGFLSKHLEHHLTGMPVAFTSSDQYQINEHGEMIGGQHPDLLAQGKRRTVAPHHVFGNSWVWATTSSMMFRRAVLDLTLPDVIEPFRRCADNLVCHFSNLIGGSVLIPTVLGCYRRHGVNYFSQNRIVGGQHPTGDMRTHPAHPNVREVIVSHLLKNADRFIAVLGEWPYLRLLSRSMNFGEAIRFARNPGTHAKLFSRRSTIAFLMTSFMQRLRWALRDIWYAGPVITPVD